MSFNRKELKTIDKINLLVFKIQWSKYDIMILEGKK